MDFIGIGAQKSGTSWIYACLYEHPELCAPIKEIHFFSRDRYEKGQAWYESNVASCKKGLKRGEFSTSYLYHPEAAKRIAAMYSQVKIICVIRNPIDRSYSQYRNAIKAGEITRQVSFEEYIVNEPSALEQGLYYNQLMTYYEYFSYKQFHLGIYEDIKTDPATFMKDLYTFLEVDPEFEPTMLKKYINIGRDPKLIFIEKTMHFIAEVLRKFWLDKLVWLVRKSGVPDYIRSLNTKAEVKTVTGEPFDRAPLVEYYKDDVAKLSRLVHRDLATEWNIS